MDTSLISRIRDQAASQPRSLPFPPASEKDIEEAQTRLGFPIPELLKLLYLNVGNGGFGPGYGVIGVNGGYESDYGTLVQIYHQFNKSLAQEGKRWKDGLLPFCEWGCNIFSCVDCKDVSHKIYISECLDIAARNFNLHDFFQMWLQNIDILSRDRPPQETAEIINPFTGQKTRVKKRRQQ